MGYDLHITRKEFWSDEEGPTIPLAEWQDYVANDPEIKRDPENPESDNYILNERYENWPLWWDSCGEVYTKNPRPSVIAKLVQIARALDARVLGDDEEIYGVEPSDPTVAQRR